MTITRTIPHYSKTDVDGLLAGKASVVHAHAIGDITGLQSALDGKAASSHTHAISDVTDLSTSLAAKANLSGGNTFAGNQTFTGGVWNVFPDATGTGAVVELFKDAATGDRPRLRIYGYADSAGTGKRYADIYIDTWDRLWFGGNANGVLFEKPLSVNNQLNLNGTSSVCLYGGPNAWSGTKQFAKLGVQRNTGTSPPRRCAFLIDHNSGQDYDIPDTESAAVYVMANSGGANAKWLRTRHDSTDAWIETKNGEGSIKTNAPIEVDVAGGSIVLKSPDGTRYRITVSDAGALEVNAA